MRSVETLFGEGDRDTRNARYSDALAMVHEHYPKDVDAAALYALSLLGKQLKRDPALYMRAAAVLEDYFPDNQQHPGVVHYMIHSYDDPVHAPLGMRAARLYGKIAPDSAHAQHMTSHIFIAMGMWPEVIHANLESLATSTRSSDSGAEGGRGLQPCEFVAAIWILANGGDAEGARSSSELCSKDDGGGCGPYSVRVCARDDRALCDGHAAVG